MTTEDAGQPADDERTQTELCAPVDAKLGDRTAPAPAAGETDIVGVSDSWRSVLRWVGVALAGFISLNEVDRLIAAGSPSAERSWTVGEVIGPFAWSARGAWSTWTVSGPSVPGLVVIHTLCDGVFVLGYAVLLWRLVLRLSSPTGSDPVADHEPSCPLWVCWLKTKVRQFLLAGPDGWLRRLIVGLVTVEVIEAGLLVACAILLPGGVSAALTGMVAGFAVTKWVVVLAFVAVWVAARAPRRMLTISLRRTRKAVKYQRLGGLALGLLALLSLVPGRDLFDQLPDVQRRWLDDGQGIGHLVFAAVGTVLFTTVTFVVGRIRAERANAYFRGRGELEDRPEVRIWWLVVPAVVAVGAAALHVWGPDDLVDWRQVATFALPPFLLGLVSFCKALRTRAPLVQSGGYGETDGAAIATAVAIAGDFLAFAALTVGGLGLVRSFTAPLVLGQPGAVPWIVIATALLTVVVVAPWLAPKAADALVGSCGMTRRVLDPAQERKDADGSLRRGTVMVGMAFAMVVFAAFALVPTRVTHIVGVTATAGILLAAWVIVLGTAQIATQYAQPLAAFRVLGLKATPVITLVVMIGVANGLVGGDADLHRIGGFDPVPTTGKPTVAAAMGRQMVSTRFSTWRDDGRDCALVLDTDSGPVSVRPLLLVAARGGGVRAAYWTARGLAALGGPGTCADRAVLLSSGVSGGSLGLVTSHVLGPDPGPDGLRTASTDLTSPDALAAATAGLFDADVFGNLTGIRLPSTGVPGDPGWAWRDRARLMEQTWDAQVSGFGLPTDDVTRGRAGSLLLNSTDAPTGCRVLISQLSVGGAGSADAALPCGNGGSVAASTDYLAGPQCPRTISWSTAAMLSARFPFVTPAGRTTPCDRDEEGLQLVDGGYAESSGLGTLSDLAPTIMEAVGGENVRVAHHGGTYVVPIVIDLNNGFGSDIRPPTPGLALEPVVPAVGALSGSRQGKDPASWAARLTTQLASPCPTAVGACASAAAQLRARTGIVVSLAPATEPAVTAPLGWTLSQASRRTLDRSLRCDEPAAARTCEGLRGLQALVDHAPG